MPTSKQVDRRYPEAYEWNEKREREGHTRMRHAPFIGILVGLLGWLIAVQILTRLLASSVAMEIGSLIALVIGLAFYKWWHDSGLNMILRAQQTLVAIDTEHNTRKIAETLQQAERKSQPVVPE